MSVTTAETIRPFTIPVATRAELRDLRARIENTRWPDREPVSDHSPRYAPASGRYAR